MGGGAVRLSSLPAVLLIAFLTFQKVSGFLPALVFRCWVLASVLVLVFLFNPAGRREKTQTWGPRICRACDVILMVLAVLASWQISLFDSGRADLHGLAQRELWSGTLLLLLLLEAGRRLWGWPLSALSLVFLVYALLGSPFPGELAPFPLPVVLRFQVSSVHAIYGSSLAVVSGTVFAFVLLSTLLARSGGVKWLVRFALAVSGPWRGGAAKAAVLASMGMGSLPGSAMANVLSTGDITIPLMKRRGYSAARAAGVVAASSTGGQLMPPVMGAGVFVMSQLTGLPYSTLLLASIVPGLLYFAATLLSVHFMSCRLGLRAEAGASIASTWKDGWPHLLPLAGLTLLLLLGYSPPLVALLGCGVMVLMGQLHGQQTNRFWWLLAIRDAGLATVPLSLACSLAGIVVGVIKQTGMVGMLTAGLLSLAGHNLFWAFLLVTGLTFVVGMGLPVASAYVVLSAITVPVFVRLGVGVVTAHLVIFWLTQTSNLSPPLAMAANASAGLAGCAPKDACWHGLRMGGGLLPIPLLMLYSPLIYQPGVALSAVGWAGMEALFSLLCLVAAREGFLLTRLAWPARLALLALAVLHFPRFWGWWSLVLLALTLAWQGRRAYRLRESI